METKYFAWIQFRKQHQISSIENVCFGFTLESSYQEHQYAVEISPQWPTTTQWSLPRSLTFIRPCPSCSESSSRILQIFMIYNCREINCQCGPIQKTHSSNFPNSAVAHVARGSSLPCCSPSFSDLAQFVRRADSKILHTFMNNCRDLVEKNSSLPNCP